MRHDYQEIAARNRRVFVHRSIRECFLKSGYNINFSKYCILDLIRRLTKEDTHSYEYGKAYLSHWLGLKPSTISEHISYLEDVGLVERTDFGLGLTDVYPKTTFDHLIKSRKPVFCILNFHIKKLISTYMNGVELTFEQFAVLTTIASIRRNKVRTIDNKFLRNTLLLDKNTIINARNKLEKLEIITYKSEIPYVNEHIMYLFSEYENSRIEKESEYEEDDLNYLPPQRKGF